jgi:hypothetical protein
MFSKNKRTLDGHNCHCKLCANEYYKENKEKMKPRRQAHYRQNKDQKCAYRRAYAKQHRGTMDYTLRQLLVKAKSRAKENNLSFDLTIEWLETMVISHCPITLQPIDWAKEQVIDGRPGPNSPSIDKNIPELGYIQSNCAIISYRANSIKSNGTLDEHRRIVQYMAAQQLRDIEF